MNRSRFRRACSIGLMLAVWSVSARVRGQTGPGTSSVEGRVYDLENRALPGATVILERSASQQSVSTLTDAQGRFLFLKVVAGTYFLRVKLPGFADASEGPFPLNENETKSPVLHVRKADESARPGKDVAADLPFSDETHFTVAGVTDTTSLGGHGSDPVRRNSDALSRDAAKLNDTSAGGSEEARIRERLPTEDNADLRFQLAEREEKSGRSLEAVHDYERAAVMDPSESHLFAWGAELLLHRAFDPSVEVFTRGRRLYPQSVRMALGLGSAMYARGSSEEAKRILLEACDIAPAEATPYRFLGGVQVTESALPDGWTDRLKRFAGLYPDNAQAHYFYAVALMKAFPDRSAISQAESELKKAVELDPRLGDAYLELGILASQRGDLPAAISYLQQAVANTTLPDDAHYRLAEVYRRLGDGEKARQESKLYKEISEKKNQELERERHELQQFVYTLREQKPASPSAPAPQ